MRLATGRPQNRGPDPVRRADIQREAGQRLADEGLRG